MQLLSKERGGHRLLQHPLPPYIPFEVRPRTRVHVRAVNLRNVLSGEVAEPQVCKEKENRPYSKWRQRHLIYPNNSLKIRELETQENGPETRAGRA